MPESRFQHIRVTVARFSLTEIHETVEPGPWHNLAMETSSLDLLYLERDSRTQQPSACIYVKSSGTQDYAGVRADKLISAHCLSFIELDAELRRLHAELDEIRARAKKKFYKAEVGTAVAGA